MPDVLIATSNTGKLREIHRLTAASRLNWLGLGLFPTLAAAIESGTTFAQNARLKALHYAGLTRLHTLADDSGLVVDALDGAPGVYSARYAGQPSDDATNNRKLRARGFRYITIQVWDVDAAHREIVERGGLEGFAPRTLGSVARISFVRDPDGNWIELSQRASLTGPLAK